MSRIEDAMGPDERQALDALRALHAPPAEPAFRARLAREFAAGTIAEGRFSGLAAADEVDPSFEDPAAAAPSPAPPARVLRGPWSRARRLTLAAAALAAAVLVAQGLNLGPDWRVVSAEGNGVVVIGDRPVPMLHAEDLARGVRRGARLRVQEGTLVLAAGRDVMIEILPGTETTLPPAPNRWWSRVARARIKSGECRITTGDGFRGAALAIGTPEAAIEVRGTTLAVIREPAGTCVCVLEGSVRVGRAGGEIAPVESGRLRFVYGEDRPAKDAAMRESEGVALRAFRERMVGAAD